MKFNNINKTLSNPLVSVIMPVYNGSRLFNETIQSILNQSYTNFEFIIVDDCSTDNSYEDLQEYAKQDKRIRLYQSPSNFGNPGGTGAYAMELSSKEAKYVLPIDQDDIATKHRLKYSVEFMESHPDVDICGGWQRLFGIKNRISKTDEFDEQIKVRLLTGCPLGHSTTIFRKSFFKKHNLNYKNQWCHDYLLWKEACLDHGAKVHAIQKVLLHYRVHEAQTSANNQPIFDAGKEIRRSQFNMLGITDPDIVDFHEEWRWKRLEHTPTNLKKLQMHLQNIIRCNAKTHIYPHKALIKRLNHLYRKELFRQGKYLTCLQYLTYKQL